MLPKSKPEALSGRQIICSRLEIGIDGYVLGNVAAKELFVASDRRYGRRRGRPSDGGGIRRGYVHHLTFSVDPAATLIGSAIRGRGVQMPPVLLALEAKAFANRANGDRVGQQASQARGARAGAALLALP
jgi:hypothetical protein